MDLKILHHRPLCKLLSHRKSIRALSKHEMFLLTKKTDKMMFLIYNGGWGWVLAMAKHKHPSGLFQGIS
jgi:hypothetical protein